MNHATYFLNQTQYDWLARKLPEPNTKTKHIIPNNELLNGILFVLKTGCRWMDIPASICVHNYSSCWRRLSYWRKCGYLKRTWQQVLILLDREDVLDLTLGHLDSSLVQSPKYEGTGYSGKHHRNGTNISLVTDRNGLPLANVLAKGNHHDLMSAEAAVKKIRVGAKKRLKELNADKAYDSATFRRHLLKHGARGNIPERQRPGKRRQHGPHPHYDKITAKLRARTERTNAWLKYYRKLRYRWERKQCMFQAIVDLACLLVCLRKVRGMRVS